MKNEVEMTGGGGENAQKIAHSAGYVGEKYFFGEKLANGRAISESHVPPFSDGGDAV
jgi:hypothetical protein